jgi:putative SOS response-associated peptidase YedK
VAEDRDREAALRDRRRGWPAARAGGLWERWKERSTGDTVQTFTIITTVPNELCASIHDRMPVILPREKWASWFGERKVDADELRWMILRPYPAELMRSYPVDARVGKARNNDPNLFDPVPSPPMPESALDNRPYHSAR